MSRRRKTFSHYTEITKHSGSATLLSLGDNWKIFFTVVVDLAAVVGKSQGFLDVSMDNAKDMIKKVLGIGTIKNQKKKHIRSKFGKKKKIVVCR